MLLLLLSLTVGQGDPSAMSARPERFPVCPDCSCLDVLSECFFCAVSLGLHSLIRGGKGTN